MLLKYTRLEPCKPSTDLQKSSPTALLPVISVQTQRRAAEGMESLPPWPSPSFPLQHLSSVASPKARRLTQYTDECKTQFMSAGNRFQSRFQSLPLASIEAPSSFSCSSQSFPVYFLTPTCWLFFILYNISQFEWSTDGICYGVGDYRSDIDLRLLHMVPVYVISVIINVATWLRYQTRLSTVTYYYSLCNYQLP